MCTQHNKLLEWVRKKDQDVSALRPVEGAEGFTARGESDERGKKNTNKKNYREKD